VLQLHFRGPSCLHFQVQVYSTGKKSACACSHPHTQIKALSARGWQSASQLEVGGGGEDGGIKVLQNTGILLQHYTAS
jgi:hypothetical protein